MFQGAELCFRGRGYVSGGWTLLCVLGITCGRKKPAGSRNLRVSTLSLMSPPNPEPTALGGRLPDPPQKS